MTRPEFEVSGSRAWLTGLVLFSSTLLCGYGIWRTGLFADSAWTDGRASMYGALAVAAALLLAHALACRIRRSTGFVVAAAALLLAACFAGLGAAVAMMLQIAAGFCLGRRLWPSSAADDSVASNAAIAIACGLALLSLAVGLLAFLPVNNPASYLVLLLLPIVWDWRGNAAAAGTVLRAWATPAPVSVPTDGRGWIVALEALIAFALLLRLLAALHPETGVDALAMHLVVAEQLKLHGSFHYDPSRSTWALMPLAGDWQFAIANMLGGQHAARLVNFVIDALIVLLVHEHAGKAWGRLAGAVAAALYATTPLLYLQTGSLFIENPWTLWCVAGLIAGLRSLRTLRTGDAVVAGLLVGAAMAAKVITVFLAPFFVAIAFAWPWTRGRGLRMLGAFAGAVAVAGSLPYANAWLRSGNPVFPFMNQVFGSPYFDATKPFGNALFSNHAAWDTLYDVTFHSEGYLEAVPGAIGIALLVFLPAALVYAAFGSWRLRWAALSALAFVVLVFRFQSYLRYVMPALPVFAVLMGAAVAGLVGYRHALLRIPVLATVVACAIAGLYLSPTSTFLYRQVSLPPYAGSEGEERYLALHRPEQTLARVIDAMQLDPVLWIGSPYYAGSDADVLTSNWHGGYARVSEFRALDSVENLRAWIARYKFRAIALAADADACERPFVCEFLEQSAQQVYRDGPVALYVIDAEAMFGTELLVNGEFDHDARGWAGAGRYLSEQGAVVVTAQASLTQSVPVDPGASYAIEVEGRCTDQGGSFRSQVNWLDDTGDFIDTNIKVFECTTQYASQESVVVAPQDAAVAVVYASGHLPDKSVEITKVSFRQ